MKINYMIKSQQIRFMKHCIGLENRKVKGNKHRKYEAYRNYFTTADDDFEWDDLVEQGLAGKRDFPNGCGKNPKLYYLTKLGIEFLGEITGIQITEDKR